MAFDFSAISAWTKEEANKAMFMTKSVMGGKTAQNMRVLTGIKGTTKIPKITADYDILQSGATCGFNASGDVNFEQTTITPKSFKVNIQLCIRELETYFTQQLLKPSQQYVGLGEFESLIMDEIKRQIQKVVELNIWRGVDGGASAVASLNIMDGLNQYISDNLGSIPTAQKLSGSVAAGSIIASLRAMRNALPIDQFDEASEASKYILFLSPVAKARYDQAYQDAYPALIYNTSYNKTMLDGSMIEIVSAPGLFGLNSDGYGLLVKRESLWLGVDVSGEENNFKIYMDEDEEYVRIKARFKMGVAIDEPEEIVTNNY